MKTSKKRLKTGGKTEVVKLEKHSGNLLIKTNAHIVIVTLQFLYPSSCISFKFILRLIIRLTLVYIHRFYPLKQHQFAQSKLWKSFLWTKIVKVLSINTLFYFYLTLYRRRRIRHSSLFYAFLMILGLIITLDIVTHYTIFRLLINHIEYSSLKIETKCELHLKLLLHLCNFGSNIHNW